MMRRILLWLFRSRETGVITIAQPPNLVLWIVIVAAALRWMWPSQGTYNICMTVVVTGGILIWAADEILRGVNPWRRFLGMAVAVYEIASILFR